MNPDERAKLKAMCEGWRHGGTTSDVDWGWIAYGAIPELLEDVERLETKAKERVEYIVLLEQALSKAKKALESWPRTYQTREGKEALAAIRALEEARP